MANNQKWRQMLENFEQIKVMNIIYTIKHCTIDSLCVQLSWNCYFPSYITEKVFESNDLWFIAEHFSAIEWEVNYYPQHIQMMIKCKFHIKRLKLRVGIGIHRHILCKFSQFLFIERFDMMINEWMSLQFFLKAY